MDVPRHLLSLYVRHLQDVLETECGEECRKCVEILEKERLQLEELSVRELETIIFRPRKRPY